MQQRFLLQILLFAQHFRASLCPSSGAQEYYTVVAACGISCCGFSSSWSCVELRVMCPVCRMLQHPANRRCTSLLLTGGQYCAWPVFDGNLSDIIPRNVLMESWQVCLFWTNKKFMYIFKIWALYRQVKFVFWDLSFPRQLWFRVWF